MKATFFCETRKRYDMKRFLVKSLMFLLCLTGFLMHSYFKIRLFYDQEPITEYANEWTKYLNSDSEEGELIKLPSFSVCFSGSLFERPVNAPKANLLTSNQRGSPSYFNSRQHLPPNVALLNDFEQTQFDDGFELRRRHIFAPNSEHQTGNLHSPRSVNQMITVDQAFGLMSKPRFSIKCDLIKPTKQRKLTRFTGNPLSCEQIASVVESINYEADQKCFTFFSQLQQSEDIEEDDFLVYRSDLNGDDLVRIRILFEEEILVSKSNQAQVHLLIHNNVEMPNFQQMKTHSLSSSHNYIIYFNRLAYKRKDTNQSPCRLYTSKPTKELLSFAYLQKVPNVLMDYQARVKNQLYKFLFSSKETNTTETTIIEDAENQEHTLGIKKEAPKSQSDCMDKCHLETNRKYCICLPVGVNVRRELLSENDLFCDQLRCIQDDLLSTATSTGKNLFRNENLRKNQPIRSIHSEQFERLYTISNNQFVSKRYEQFKKCLGKNNCIASCDEDRYDYSISEKPDFNLIVQNILGNLPSNLTRNLSSRNIKKFGRFNYYTNGFYYDPTYKQQQTFLPTSPKVERKKFSFLQQPQTQNKNTSATSNSFNRPKEAADSSTSTAKSSAIDDFSHTYHKINDTAFPDTTRLNKSIIVNVTKKNGSSVTTNSVINRRAGNSNQQQLPSFGQADAVSDNQLKSTTSTVFDYSKTKSVATSGTVGLIDQDSINDNLDNEEDQANGEYTQPSLSKDTISSRKILKFATTSSLANANKENVSESVSNGSLDDELLDELPMGESVEERHNSIKPYESLISVRNNRNGNRTYRQRLSYSLIDLMFDLSLVAVIWLGFSVYLIADYFIYFLVLIFWHFVRLTLCLDWWFRNSRHRVVDSASSTVQLTSDKSEHHRSPKESISSQMSENQTFVKAIP